MVKEEGKVMDDSNIRECEETMSGKLSGLERELARVRTGKASVNVLDGIRVDYYGTPTALNQVASISTPDPKTIVISPFEKKLLSAIEKAIYVADIGLQPNNDGNIIRLPIPQLTEERRKEIAKSIKKIGEDFKVAIRKIRQDVNTKVKKQEKAKEVNEDESKALQKEVQTITDKFIKRTDEAVKKKEGEVLTL